MSCELPPYSPLRWGIERTAPRPATCFYCERPFTVDIAAYALACGSEVVGYMCLDCLCPNARRTLAAAIARIREEAAR